MRRSFGLLPLLLLIAAPLAAQDPRPPADTLVPPPIPAPVDTAAPVMAPPADTTIAVPAPAPAPVDTAPALAAPAAPAPAAPAADTTQTATAVPGHDWEFSLNPSSRATGASGAVQVTSGEPQNRFVVAVSGLPSVDALDAEEFDADVYTVWVVPSKDRVPESTMAGLLVVDESGGGRFEGTTDLDTFGIIVAGANEESPLLRAQGAVLTGIPVSTAPPPAETPAADAPPQPAPEAPAPESPAPDAPAPEAPAPDAAPEAPAPAAPAPEYPAPSPPPPTPPR